MRLHRQRVRDGGNDTSDHVILVEETDLALAGVHVDVDEMRRHLQREKTERVLAPGLAVGVGTVVVML